MTLEKTTASLSEVRRGVLELALLGLLAKEPGHGYALLERLSAFATLDIAAGTLYPLLRRLERDRLVRADWTEPYGGPPRKVYTLSEPGSKRLRELTAVWRQLISDMNNIVEVDLS